MARIKADQAFAVVLKDNTMHNRHELRLATDRVATIEHLMRVQGISTAVDMEVKHNG